MSGERFRNRIRTHLARVAPSNDEVVDLPERRPVPRTVRARFVDASGAL
jgi:hypothetical protein